VAPITRTLQLAEIVRRAIGRYNDTIDPATRTFQALRIWVNDELGELERGLKSAERILLPGGRLVVVTFHSLEDAIVKKFLNQASGKTEGISRHMPFVDAPGHTATFELLTRKAVKPSEAEVAGNIRARSATLRAAQRTSAPITLTKGGRS
jgi:16S rRNA (cytosine1402-N4)-methyltransferase